MLVKNRLEASSPIGGCEGKGRTLSGVVGWFIGAIVLLGGIPFVATDCSGNPHQRLYSVGATEACLSNLPDAIVGLPPANPPVPPALFVWSAPRDRMPLKANGELGVWSGRKGKKGYEGLTLTFFKTTRAARSSYKSLVWLYGGKLIRNVVVVWDGDVPAESLRSTVFDCLRAGPGGTPTPHRPPKASLATFAGYWGGHTRGLRITPGGQATESTNSGCCVRVYDMTFQIRSVSGTLTDATATFSVTSYKRHEKWGPDLAGRQVGKLLLKNGIVTNSLTEVYFCSNPAWSATMACGA